MKKLLVFAVLAVAFGAFAFSSCKGKTEATEPVVVEDIAVSDDSGNVAEETIVTDAQGNAIAGELTVIPATTTAAK